MKGRLPTLPSSMGCLELVWENGEILIRGLPSTKITEKSYFSDQYSSKAPGVLQREGETSTANRYSNDGVLPDSMFGGDPLSGLSGLSKNKINSDLKTTCGAEVLSEFYEDEDGFNVVPEPETRCYHDKQLDVDHFHIVPVVNRFRNSKQSYDQIHPQQTVNKKNGATRPGLVGAGGGEDLEGNARSAPIETTNINGSKNAPESEAQKDFLLPDEQSEAVGYIYKDRKYYKVHDPSSSLEPNIAINNGKLSVEQMVPSSSVCSRGASNCPTYTFTRRSYHEDTDLSENAMEEPEGTTKVAPARGSKGANKRKRKTEVHNLSERRRRDKINKKMRALQDLIPNCNKVDKASMLDEAIEYLKTLKLQVQMMMSMGSGFPMMLPSAMQHLGGYSPMSMNMNMMGIMRMQMGLGCGPAVAQFPTSLMPGITEPSRLNNMDMVGFPAAHMLLMSNMSRSPFVSLAATFSPQFVHTPGLSQAPASAQLEIPAPSKDSNPTN